MLQQSTANPTNSSDTTQHQGNFWNCKALALWVMDL